MQNAYAKLQQEVEELGYCLDVKEGLDGILVDPTTVYINSLYREYPELLSTMYTLVDKLEIIHQGSYFKGNLRIIDAIRDYIYQYWHEKLECMDRQQDLNDETENIFYMLMQDRIPMVVRNRLYSKEVFTTSAGHIRISIKWSQPSRSYAIYAVNENDNLRFSISTKEKNAINKETQLQEIQKVVNNIRHSKYTHASDKLVGIRDVTEDSIELYSLTKSCQDRDRYRNVTLYAGIILPRMETTQSRIKLGAHIIGNWTDYYTAPQICSARHDAKKGWVSTSDKNGRIEISDEEKRDMELEFIKFLRGGTSKYFNFGELLEVYDVNNGIFLIENIGIANPSVLFLHVNESNNINVCGLFSNTYQACHGAEQPEGIEEAIKYWKLLQHLNE